MAIGTSSPSRPGLVEVSEQPDGEIEAELGAVEFRQRAGIGLDYQPPGDIWTDMQGVFEPWRALGDRFRVV
jgi:hypothetical protein